MNSLRRIRITQRRLGLLVALAAVVSVPAAGQQVRPESRSKHPARATRAHLVEAYRKQPLSFEQVQSEEEKYARFVSRGLGYSLMLTPSEAVLALHGTSLHMKLAGASRDSAATGLEGLPGRVNYLVGNDPRRWKTDVPAFARVKYSDVYPGVDLVYYGNQRQLEYDFLVAPGADPKAIGVSVQGARSIRIDRNGDLLLETADGEVRFHKPVAYQPSPSSSRIAVGVRYVLRAHHRVAFQLGAYDRSKPVVIDPVVTFATYLGGDVDGTGQPAVTDGFGIATDPSGNIYVAGTTTAVNDGVFPVLNASQPNPPTSDPTCPSLNAFVAKLDPAGNRIYVTYLGGTHCNQGMAIAADAFGNASVTGWTESSNFPTTPGAFQTTKPNGGNGLAGFVTKFDTSGGLVYSSYIAAGSPGSVAADNAGNTFLTGGTNATFSSRTTPGAYQRSCASVDTYILKLSPAGSPLYASCLASNTGGGGIAVDTSGHIYVLGGAGPGSNLVVKNGFQSAMAGRTDAFIVKLLPGSSGAADLLYSTFFGGSQEDDATGIAADSNGHVWVVGNTGSADLPVTSTTIKPACLPRTGPGTCTAWVAKLDTTAVGAVSRLFATYLGGSSGDDNAEGVALDGAGNAYVAGFTASADFPTVNPLYSCQACASGSDSTFVTELSPAGTMLFSTFLGGSALGSDATFGIAVDSLGGIFLTGESGSESLPPGPPAPPVTPIPACMNPLQPQPVGGLDAYVVKLSPGAGAQSTTTNVASSFDPSVFGQPITLTASVGAVVCTAGTPVGTVTLLDGATTLGSSTVTNGQVAFGPLTLGVGSHSLTASYGGGAGFMPSTSAPLVQTVNRAATQTALTASSNPVSPGQVVTFTATVTPILPGAGTPGGVVTFLDGTTTLGTGPVTSGKATFPTATLSPGSHSITASSGGDSNFTGSSSAALLEQVVVSPPSINKAFGTAAMVQGLSTGLSFTIVNPNVATSLLGVGFVDTLPVGLIVTTPNGQSGSCGGGVIAAVGGSSTLSLSGATLAAGASCTFSVNVTGTSQGVITNTTGPVTSSNGGNGNQATASLTVLPSLVLISVSESIKVTDMELMPSVFINVAEAIRVTDTPATNNTPSGSNIAVQPVDTTTGGSPVKLTFANVTQPGVTSLTTSTSGPPPPSGFQLGNPAVYYNLTTTAGFTGLIRICINYAGIALQTPPGPRLFHFQNSTWTDVTTTVDTINMIVCGSSSSLSPFALFQFQSAGVHTTTSISAPGIAYGTSASVTVSVGSPSGMPTGTVSLIVDGGTASTMPLSVGSATFNLGILRAGSHSLSASFATQGNFLASSAAGTLSVAQAPLTIAANNVSRPYGANNPVLTGSLVGLQNADPITANFATTATPASVVGVYSITPVVFDPQNRLSNYTVTLVNGTLGVVPEATSLRVAISPSSVPVGHSATITVTLTAPDMVIPIDPAVLVPITVRSPVVSDILTNDGACRPVPGAAPGSATCVVTMTAVEPNGRTLNASFPGSRALAASTGTAELIVTAPVKSNVSCVSSDFHNVGVPGGSYLWFNSIFKVRGVGRQKVTITFFHSSVRFQYTDARHSIVKVNQPMPDAKIVIDPGVSSASTTFDAVDSAWITTVPFDLDDNVFLTGTPWLVPAEGLPGDVEPVTWCGTFASDTPGVDIGWRWAAAAYSSFSGNNAVLGVKPVATDDDNLSMNQDRAGTPEQLKAFVIPGARGKGGRNYTGSYTGSAKIE